MKRDIIIIEDKAVSVTGNDVWMTAGEIARLFHTGVLQKERQIYLLSEKTLLIL